MFMLPRRPVLRLAALAALVSAPLVPAVAHQPARAAAPWPSFLRPRAAAPLPNAVRSNTGVGHALISGVADVAPTSFIASLDTMKESMDSLNNPLTPAQIANDVNLSASLNTTHITVDTPYDDPGYAQQWADAIRAAGKHVWFRMSYDSWLGIYGAAATMTPAGYESAMRAFILAHASLFQPGDIFDPCPEPEQGAYWAAAYGPSWDWSPAPPNAATRESNAFVRDTSSVAAAAFQQIGVAGVNTTVRSMNPFIVEHDLEPATVAQLGRVTIDSYPEAGTTDPATAARARVDEMNGIENQWRVPIVVGEMGYSTQALVSDAVQEPVLSAEFRALQGLPYLAGVNYWTGAGYAAPDRYNGTRVFTGTVGAWTLRPAAVDLSAFFAAEAQTSPATLMIAAPPSTNTATPTMTPPPATATSTATTPPTATSTATTPPTATSTATTPPTATSTATMPPTWTTTPSRTVTATSTVQARRHATATPTPRATPPTPTARPTPRPTRTPAARPTPTRTSRSYGGKRPRSGSTGV